MKYRIRTVTYKNGTSHHYCEYKFMFFWNLCYMESYIRFHAVYKKYEDAKNYIDKRIGREVAMVTKTGVN